MDKVLNRYKVLVICLGLTLSAVAVYWQVINYKFINFDDLVYIVNNSNVNNGFSYSNIVWAFKSYHASNWHPLTWMSHMLDCQLFGTKAGWHHLTNLLLHIANILLLFTVLRKITGAVWQSAFVAGLFALHPMHVESVVWVSERKDVLSTLFLLLTMLAYAGYVKRLSIWRYVLTLLLFTLGLLAKPMLVTLPFVLLLLDYWPLQRFGDKRPRYKTISRLILEKVPFAVLSVGSSIMTFIAQHAGGAVADISKLPLDLRAANALVSYLKYIGKMFWPTDLVMFYLYPLRSLTIWDALLCAAILVVISAVVIWFGRQHKFLIMGWLWFVGTLVPVIGLVQVGDQAMADRYTYIPYTGLFIMIAWGLPVVLMKWRYRNIALGVSAAVVLVALSVCTYIQQQYWHDSITLFERVLKITDNNYMAHHCIALPLRDMGKKDEALEHDKEAVRINPYFAGAWNGIGLAMLIDKNNPDEAITYLNKALEINPNSIEAQCNLGRAMMAKGDFAAAVKDFQKLVQMLPDNEESNYLLGTAFANQGNLNAAMPYFEKAVRIKPRFAVAQADYGNALVRQNKLNEGIAHLTEGLKLDPNLVEARIELGFALANQGKLDEAAKEYEKLLATHPENPVVHNDYAVLLFRQGKFAEAIKHFKEAIRIKPDYENAKNNLQAVLATQEKASKSTN